MIVLNFAHPFSEKQIGRLERLTDQTVQNEINLLVQFDHEKSFETQLQALMTSIPLTPGQWQTEPILVNLPAFSVIAALTLAALHGRMGYFPPVVRMMPVAGTTPTRFEVAEVINLQNLREQARKERK